MNKVEKNELVFYQCDICGNLIIKLEDSGITPTCCSRTMTRLEVNHDKKMEEEHVPVWRMNGCKVMIQVGENLHSMSANHYIKWIIVKTNRGIHMRRFETYEIPEVTITLDRGEWVLEIYSFCNVHGLWKAEVEESL